MTQNSMAANRKHKDRLFRLLFNNPNMLLRGSLSIADLYKKIVRTQALVDFLRKENAVANSVKIKKIGIFCKILKKRARNDKIIYHFLLFLIDKLMVKLDERRSSIIIVIIEFVGDRGHGYFCLGRKKNKRI